MFGTIYKITNIINNKVYVGQTTRPYMQRFERHLKDAENNILPSNFFHKAIRKYGRNNFKIEIIDTANTKEELNTKEIYWIDFYMQLGISYNTAKGGQGGNTYYKRTQEQMCITKQKISKANFGMKNGMHKAVRVYNVITNEIKDFESITAVLSFLGIKHKETVSWRANGRDKTVYKNTYTFEFI